MSMTGTTFEPLLGGSVIAQKKEYLCGCYKRPEGIFVLTTAMGCYHHAHHELRKDNISMLQSRMAERGAGVFASGVAGWFGRPTVTPRHPQPSQTTALHQPHCIIPRIGSSTGAEIRMNLRWLRWCCDDIKFPSERVIFSRNERTGGTIGRSFQTEAPPMMCEQQRDKWSLPVMLRLSIRSLQTFLNGFFITFVHHAYSRMTHESSQFNIDLQRTSRKTAELPVNNACCIGPILLYGLRALWSHYQHWKRDHIFCIPIHCRRPGEYALSSSFDSIIPFRFMPMYTYASPQISRVTNALVGYGFDVNSNNTRSLISQWKHSLTDIAHTAVKIRFLRIKPLSKYPWSTLELYYQILYLPAIAA